MQPPDPNVTATADALYSYGEKLARQGKFTEAYEFFCQALAINPNDDRAWVWRAGVCSSPGEALTCLRQALQINPNNQKARKGLAWAEQRVQDAQRQEQVDATESSNAGSTEVSVDAEAEETLVEWEPQLEPSPTMQVEVPTWQPTPLLTNSSNIKRGQNLPQQREPVRYEMPPTPISMQEMPISMQEMGPALSGTGAEQVDQNMGPAVMLIKKPVFVDAPSGRQTNKLEPASASKMDIADLLQKTKVAINESRFGKAEQLLQEILATAPDSYEAHAQFGVLYYHCERYTDAIASFMRAVEYNPNYADAHFSLGVVYEEIGRFRDALREWVLTQRINPDYPDVHDAILSVRKRINEQEALGPQPTTICPHCTKRVSGRLMTCPYCKKNIYTLCPNCEEYVDRAFASCPTCGAAVLHNLTYEPSRLVPGTMQEPEKEKKRILGLFGKK